MRIICPRWHAECREIERAQVLVPPVGALLVHCVRCGVICSVSETWEDTQQADRVEVGRRGGKWQ